MPKLPSNNSSEDDFGNDEKSQLPTAVNKRSDPGEGGCETLAPLMNGDCSETQNFSQNPPDATNPPPEPNADGTLDFSISEVVRVARPSTGDGAVSPPTSQMRVPRQIGDYRIERILGRGGMGIVYKARQTKLGRDVALKMVLAGAHASDDVLTRFIAEAKAVAHLQHPNIVQIFEVGEHEGLPFFSLEYVDGNSLDKRVAGKPLPPEDAARLTITLCEAMQYAHEHGVLHRDLKPANILMTSAGVPKVTDFGLAKRLEDADDTSSTRTGTIMGTPSYMSPEQARGAVKELGPATDQYSLGAILYEFLTGRPPFVAPKPFDVILQVLRNEPISPKQFLPKMPVDIETICLKALQKDPAKRYGSCAEMASDLGRFLRNEPIQARPVGPIEHAWRWCRRNPLVASLSTAAIMALLAVAIVSTWSTLTLRDKNAQLVKSQEATLEQARIAKENETKAVEQEGIAVSRAKSIVEVVQEFYSEVRGIDVFQMPRMKETRDRMMRVLLPVVEREVLSQNPKDDDAIKTHAALQMSVADSMVSQNMTESAEKIYLQLEQLFRERAEKKKTDAARANHILMLRPLGNLKRELARDMTASLAYFEQVLAIASDVVNNSRSDENGLGKKSDFQRYKNLAVSHHDLAVTLYRIGDVNAAHRHFDTAIQTYMALQAFIDTDPDIALKKEAGKLQAIREIQALTAISEFANSFVVYRQGQPEVAEPVIRRLTEEARKAQEGDVTNAQSLRDYCGKLGILAEFLAQTDRIDEAMPLFNEAAMLGDKLLTFAPDNSEFQRTTALAYYRKCQWEREQKRPEAETAGRRALALRTSRVKYDPLNDRFRIELMLSEAQCGKPVEALRVADEFAEKLVVDNELLIEIARTYAQISERSPESERLTLMNKATEAIRRAAKQQHQDSVSLTKEIDLKPLRVYPPFLEIASLDR